MVQQQGDLRSQVLAAFQRLPAKVDLKHELETAVSVVVVLARSDAVEQRKEAPLPAFHAIGRERVCEELKRLATYADRIDKPRRKGQDDPVVKMASHMRTLHGPTIDALAARGVLRHDLSNPVRIAVAARYVDLSRLPAVLGGRPANLRAQGIAKVLAWHYAAVTGKPPKVVHIPDTADYGPFVELVCNVFKIAGIRANPLAAARVAVPPIPRSKARDSGLQK